MERFRRGEVRSDGVFSSKERAEGADKLRTNDWGGFQCRENKVSRDRRPGGLSGL